MAMFVSVYYLRSSVYVVDGWIHVTSNFNISHNIACTLDVEELTLTAFTGGEERWDKYSPNALRSI